MSGKLASVLQPSKFLLMILQVIAISVIMKIKDQHIYVGILKSLDTSSAQYQSASGSIMWWCRLAIAALVVEFLMIFSGKTLFNDKYNLMVIGSHILGLFLTTMFMQYEWHYLHIRWVFFVAGVAPLCIETLSYLYSKMNYRNTFNVK